MLALKRKAVLALMVAVLAMAAVSPVLAGTNGQQIRLYNAVYTSNACVNGYNQNTQWVGGCWWLANNNSGQYNNLSGWWWKYTVQIHRTDSFYNVLATRFDCDVPVSQSGSDYYACLAP